MFGQTFPNFHQMFKSLGGGAFGSPVPGPRGRNAMRTACACCFGHGWAQCNVHGFCMLLSSWSVSSSCSRFCLAPGVAMQCTRPSHAALIVVGARCARLWHAAFGVVGLIFLSCFGPAPWGRNSMCSTFACCFDRGWARCGRLWHIAFGVFGSVFLFVFLSGPRGSQRTARGFCMPF